MPAYPAPWPNHEFGLTPFWFWNDHLDHAEIRRRIADFEDHGVGGFILHPRVGLPKDCGWMSPKLLDFMETALIEARRRGLVVYLYDEGMYPSGSASGRVVARDPALANRGLQRVVVAAGEAQQPWQAFFRPGDDARLVLDFTDAGGRRTLIVDRKTHATIRGLHYREEPPPGTPHDDRLEEAPLAGDILNPEAVRVFIEESYDAYALRFGDYFGQPVAGVFTDEPSLLGRLGDKSFRPGNLNFVKTLSDWLGGDFTPSLPALWDDTFPDAAQLRRAYHRGLQRCLEESYYRPLARWCADHGINLIGHPDEPDNLAHLRCFQIPGQDLVWRWVEPGQPSGLEGPQSTQAKAAASAMVLTGARRNANEYCGAYGPDFTFEEMQRLTWWLAVRGCNLLIPHAFYWSTRGPRLTERPPDVGPNQPWWPRFRPFADCARYLCWLNTDSETVCDVALLASGEGLPWQPAKDLFEHQVDFLYLEESDLLGAAEVNADSVRIGPLTFRAVVCAAPPGPAVAERLAVFGGLAPAGPEGAAPLDHIGGLTRCRPVLDGSHPTLRQRRVRKDGRDHLIFFNESDRPVEAGFVSKYLRLVLEWDSARPPQQFDLQDRPAERFRFPPFGLAVLATSA
ncbi:MAG: hypothetical protein EA425_12435 [Puniceicoccaceae bacterium]|nr:MAG: hypothetical protein EA425_12435 [Puniceicoccaceae bacterium]